MSGTTSERKQNTILEDIADGITVIAPPGGLLVAQNRGMSLVTTSVTLVANAVTTVITANDARKYLAIQVTGLNDVTVGGFILNGAPSVGKSGGCIIWESNIPTGAITAVSVLGSSVSVVSGV